METLLAIAFIISLIVSAYYVLSRLWFITMPVGLLLLLVWYTTSHSASAVVSALPPAA